jgi:predicted ribosome quality control (RQC) complex YloA/Tae2 family protein
MPLDAVCIAAVKDELAAALKGARIDKIQQPERDVIILSLRGGMERTGRLLISAGTGETRVHLTSHRFDNPKAPPMFCMLLRKHLTGAKILDIKQPPLERVLEIELETSSAMGEISVKHLIVELIGGMPNIILRDSDGRIIDCLRRIGGEMDDRRIVLPGLMYRTPPLQEGKHNPLDVTSEEWDGLIASASSAGILNKWLLSTFTALSPLICRELVRRAYGEVDIRFETIVDKSDALKLEFYSLMGKIKAAEYEPWMLVDADNTPRDFSYTCIRQYEGLYKAEKKESFSSMLDDYFTRSAQQSRIRQRATTTLKLMNTARKRLIRKLTAQKAELEETIKRDYLRECGDLITANLHTMRSGLNILVAPDFYSEEGKTRDIKLDPLLTPQQNAAKYYKAYTKAKTAAKFLSEQIRLGEGELEYVESVIDQIERASLVQDLDEIRDELMLTGYIKAKKQQKEKRTEAKPMQFISSAGLRIFAGKNNIQNDKLTKKTASKSDVWLHAQKIHGAHVILACEGSPPDEASLYEAAVIAAYHSAARSSGKVPVDYTPVKNVKKQPGGRPGMVLYTDYKTIIATPDEDLVTRLRIE